MIRGINHITLAVSNVERSFSFYRDVLQFRPLARWTRGVYLLAGTSWWCLSVDASVKQNQHTDYTHVGLDVAPDEFAVTAARIRAVAPIWKENTSEGDSLYFLDPDGHRLELHASSWESRLAACRQAPYDGMIFFD